MITSEYPPVLSGIGDYTFQLVKHLRLLDQAPEIAVSPHWQEEPLSRAISEFSADLIHFQYMTTLYQNRAEACFLPAFVKKKFPSIPVVTTYHEFAAPWKRLALWPLLRRSDAHIVTNERHFDFLKTFQKTGILKGMIRKIPLGTTVFPVEENRQEREALRARLKIGAGELLFTRFGIIHDVIVPELVRLTKIFEQARNEGLPVRLLLLGKAEPAAEAKLRREACGPFLLEKDLSHEMVSRCLRASDAGVALYPDGVSEKRTALSALFSHGLPVLATQLGKLPPEFIDGENMICVSVKAGAREWINAVSRMVREDDLRARLSKGSSVLASLHDWNQIAMKTFELYREVTA